ncbi:MAG: 50S ribosomal protein L25/general stress protein Ctc [Ferrimonas sp.]
MSEFVFEAKTRQAQGTGASRRLRRNNLLPAILYGADKPPVALVLEHDKINIAQEKEAFYSQVLTLKVDGVAEQVIVKAVQRHPFKPKLIHLDFQRVTKGNVLTTTVPLHFLNEDQCAGARAGGTIVHLLNEVEVKCKPEDLPEFIEVDLQHLATNQALHLHDIPLPKGVLLTELTKGDDHDLTVVRIQPPKGGSDEETDDNGNQPSAD